MGFFITLLIFAALTLLSEFLKPSPRDNNQRPSSLGDFNFPTATERRAVPIVWGTVKLSGPNVVWFGDLRPVAITQSVKTGLFSSTNVVTGFKYFVGVQMGLCRGQIDSILRVWVDDEVIWDVGISADGVISIDRPGFLGGSNGSGGIVGDVSVRLGSESQAVVSYLTEFQAQGGDTPAYRGTVHAVLEGVYIGNSTSVKPWQWEVRRVPNGLGLAVPGVNNGNDANPMNVIYEILTNDEWGLGLPVGDIDTQRFILAAQTLATEGNGWSFTLDSPREAFDIIQELQRQIDGVVFLNRKTGKWDVNLARGGFNIDAVPQADESNVIEVQEFTRGSWNETQNIVQIGFASRARDYQETFALAQDMANIRTQVGQIVKSETDYPGVKDSDLAAQIAWRDLRVASFPLARVSLVLNREFALVNPGDVLAWTDSDLGFTKFPLRVVKVDMGELASGRVVVEAVQDVFVTASASFSPPGPGGWTAPTNVVVDIPLADRRVFEAPAAFVDRDPGLPGVRDRVWMGLLSQDDGAISAQIAVSPGEVNAGSIASFMVAGELKADLAASASMTADVTIDSIPSTASAILDAIDAATADQVGDGLVNLALINGEFVGFLGAISGGPGEVVLQDVIRCMLDSVPPVDGHSLGDRVWILSAGGSLTDSAFSGTVALRPLPVSNTDALAFNSSTSSVVVMDSRAQRPYPPCDPKVGASTAYGGSFTIDSGVSVPGSGDNGKGLTLNFTRRDFRLGNEVAKLEDETSLPPDFPGVNATEYRVEVFKDPASTPVSLFTTAWSGAGSVGISRNEVLAANGGVVPSDILLSVQTRHDFEGTVLEARDKLEAVVGITSALTSLSNLGVVAQNVATAAFVAPTAGVYNLSIGDALGGGEVQVSINSGAWAAVITGSNTVGGFSAGVSDSLRFRHTAPSNPGLRFLSVDAPSSSSDAYAILDL